ncbi:MAG: hypothetical protein BWX61_01428 [Bacteroidetes bacterium ADurb.Bin035]|nr:MAG: hypothetical protein BWX61_01428 [Bacteroidetes bacterium ADurb.Bin035]
MPKYLSIRSNKSLFRAASSNLLSSCLIIFNFLKQVIMASISSLIKAFKRFNNIFRVFKSNAPTIPTSIITIVDGGLTKILAG